MQFTDKSREELAALGLGLHERDVVELLQYLTHRDTLWRIRSRATGEWLYVFRPLVAGVEVYAKVALRANCVVISFHGATNEDED